jgi:hypothetical protein
MLPRMKVGDRPLLFLDVDGPLIPIGGRHDAVDNQPAYRLTPVLARALAANPLLYRLDPRRGRWLAALPCELVWATTWMADANEVIGPLLGLPELPVVQWPPDADDDPSGSVHWKTQGLVDWAAGRCFVWLDDEITDADRRWVHAHHATPALLHRVDPRRGLTRDDIDAVDRWLADLPADRRLPDRADPHTM